MITNSELLNILCAEKANFYMADLHVHTWASADIWDTGRFEALSVAERKILEQHRNLIVPLRDDAAELETELLKIINPADYLRLLINHKESVAQRFQLSQGEDWAVVGLTDHNVCKFSCNVAQEAWKTRTENRIICFPGLELDIAYDVKIADEKTVAMNVHARSQLFDRPISSYLTGRWTSPVWFS